MPMILDNKPELRAKIKKYGKWVVIFFVFAFIMELVGNFIYSFDEDKGRVENFLLNNKLINIKAGDIKKISFQNLINFSGDENKDAYKEYMYRIKGTNADVLVRVKLNKLCDEGEQCLKITSME